jgi:hypothetical protein
MAMNDFGAVLFLIFRRIISGTAIFNRILGVPSIVVSIILATSQNRRYRLFLARSTDIVATAHKTRMALESPSNSTCDCKVG